MGLKISRLLMMVLFLLLVACGNSTTDTQGETGKDLSVEKSIYQQPIKFNSGWLFYRDNAVLSFEDAKKIASWQEVSLPHTPKIEPKIVNDQWQGDAWYRKDIEFKTSWIGKKTILDFEGAMNASEVWLNDKKLASHQGGYLPFSVDLTGHLLKGKNTLYVRLDNRDNPITGPKPLEILDFNMFGGIYRNVWLRIENPIHITNAVAAGEVASGGVFVRYPRVSEEESEVSIQTHLANAGEAKQVQLIQRILDGDKELAKDQISLELPSGGATGASQILSIKSPKLWSPGSPSLYTLKSQVVVDGVIFDEEENKIGIREFKVEKGAFYVNGEKHFLRGVNRHQEYPYIGYALSDAAQYRDAEKIKAAGFDYVRLSHYPHAKAFMRAADELGLVLLDAILGWQYINEDPKFLDHVVQTCRDMIRRDRNHPSVFAWECSLNESGMDESLIDQFQKVVHEEFPGENVYSAGWLEYGYDIYLQARQHRLDHYKDPAKPYIVSEYGDWEYYAMNAGLNQDSWGNLKQEERSSRQLLSDGDLRLQQQAANISEAHNDNFNTPAFADGYWVMFDYNRGYADDLEASGIMSIDRLPKFSHYFYQSQRDADDFSGPLVEGYMVYIASHWQENSSLEFDVYSNAEEVELLLNGKSIARSRPNNSQYPNVAHAPFNFRLDTFIPGELKAIAYAGGEKVAQHRVKTPGEATSIHLSLDKSSKAPQAGVNDLLFVYADILDDSGNTTRLNHADVEFVVSGDAELISPKMTKSEAGIAAALIRLGDNLESISINASYKGIESNTLVLEPQS